VRAFKNRFGAVNELGVFAMTDKGLRASPIFRDFPVAARGEVAGSCVLVTQEGTRPLLVEIQALVDAAHAPNPRRLSVGLEQNRLAMLLAVLHRHAGIACYDQDVFVNAVGALASRSPRPISRCCWRSSHASPTSRSQRSSRCSARSGSRGRCVPRRAARSA